MPSSDINICYVRMHCLFVLCYVCMFAVCPKRERKREREREKQSRERERGIRFSDSTQLQIRTPRRRTQQLTVQVGAVAAVCSTHVASLGGHKPHGAKITCQLLYLQLLCASLNLGSGVKA